MKGTVFKGVSKTGRVTWRYQVDAGRDPQTGKRIREGESGFKLERDAYDAMHEAIEDLKTGRVRSTRTLKEFLDQWLPYHAKAKPLAPKSIERYTSLAAHATRALGAVQLKDLNPFMLDDLYVKLSEKLSPKTVRGVHNVIHVAMKRAVKTKLLKFNPADGCDLPEADPKEKIALAPDQLAAFQSTATGTWVDLLIRLAAATGARRGELLACKWSDLTWETSELRIERSLYQIKKEIGIKPTKTRRPRIVTLPASMIEYLKIHREQQEQHRKLYGQDYRTDLDLILADPAGDFLRPSSVSRATVRLAKKAGLKNVGLHTMRHTHASVLLHAGVPITNVSQRLGHCDVYTTAKVYAHALPNTDKDVAATWDKLTNKPKNRAKAQTGTNQGSRNTATVDKSVS